MAAITTCSGGATVFRRSPAYLRPPSSYSAALQPSTPKFPRLFVCHGKRRVLEHIKKASIICCAVEENTEPESESSKVASVDLKLPRRSLLVSFTCNSCGARSQRLMNRLAYERGTVFLQCSGCLQYHKFVDNLGLVVEYNLLEDGVTDSSSN